MVVNKDVPVAKFLGPLSVSSDRRGISSEFCLRVHDSDFHRALSSVRALFRAAGSLTTNANPARSQLSRNSQGGVGE